MNQQEIPSESIKELVVALVGKLDDHDTLIEISTLMKSNQASFIEHRDNTKIELGKMGQSIQAVHERMDKGTHWIIGLFLAILTLMISLASFVASFILKK